MRKGLTDNEYPYEPDDAELHVAVVEQDVGEVGREESIHAAGRADQVHVRVEDGGAERSGQDACHVNGSYSQRPVHHFQRQSYQDLD